MKAHVLPQTTKAEIRFMLILSETLLSLKNNAVAGVIRFQQSIQKVSGGVNGGKGYLSAISYYAFNIGKQALRDSFLGSETEMEFLIIMARHYISVITKVIRYQSDKIIQLKSRYTVIRNQKQAA